MLGEPIHDLSQAVALCDRIRLDAVSPAGQRDCFGNSLRCAVELAVLDAVARACGRPLSDVTTLVAETIGLRQNEKRVRYSAVLTRSRRSKPCSAAWLSACWASTSAR